MAGRSDVRQHSTFLQLDWNCGCHPIQPKFCDSQDRGNKSSIPLIPRPKHQHQQDWTCRMAESFQHKRNVQAAKPQLPWSKLVFAVDRYYGRRRIRVQSIKLVHARWLGKSLVFSSKQAQLSSSSWCAGIPRILGHVGSVLDYHQKQDCFPRKGAPKRWRTQGWRRQDCQASCRSSHGAECCWSSSAASIPLRAETSNLCNL